MPQGISIPDNYRGNAFSPHGGDEAEIAHKNDRQRGSDQDPRKQQCGGENGSRCGEAQRPNRAEPCDAPACNVRHEAPGDHRSGDSRRECEECRDGCGTTDRGGHGCDRREDRHEDGCGECGKEDRKSSPQPVCREGFMNLSIGNEELLLLGVMALIFFGEGKRDNELLVCLLLVLLI